MKIKWPLFTLFFSLSLATFSHSASLAAEVANTSSLDASTSAYKKITITEQVSPIEFDSKKRAQRIFDQNGIQLDVKEYSVNKLSIGSSRVYLALTNNSEHKIKLSLTTVAFGTQYISTATTITQGEAPKDLSKIPCLEDDEELSINKCVENINKQLPTSVKITDLFSPLPLPTKDNSLLEITAEPGEIVRFSIYQTFWDESFRNNDVVKGMPANSLQRLIDSTAGTPQNGKLPLTITITDAATAKTISNLNLQFEVMEFTDERKIVLLHDIYNLYFEKK
ncbi:hypothetical protein D1872_222180 [compost metagenome]